MLGASKVGPVPMKARSCDFSTIIKLRTDLVRNFLLFAGIPVEDCARIVAAAQERNYPSSKTIFCEGDSVRHVMLLTSGCVKLSQSGPMGQEVILRMVGPGENLCAECFPKCSHCSTARTVLRSTVLVWEAGQFESAAARFPAFGRNISSVLLQTLNELEIRFRELCTEKVAPRLSSQLVRLASQVGRPADGHVEILLSRRELAQLTGTTLFTVSRLLCQWEEKGYVRPRRRSVVVIDIPALESLSHLE